MAWILYNLVTFEFKARGIILVNLNQEGCMRGMLEQLVKDRVMREACWSNLLRTGL